MAVNITIDLDAAKAFGKIGALKSSLKGLDDNLDFDGIDFGLDESIDDLNELADALDEIQKGFDDIDVAGFRAATDGGAPPGTSGGAGGGDGGRFDRQRLANRITTRFNLDDDGVPLDPDSLKGMTIDEVRADLAEFHFDRTGNFGPERNLGAHAVPGEFQMGKDGKFVGGRGPQPSFRQELLSQRIGKITGSRRLMDKARRTDVGKLRGILGFDGEGSQLRRTLGNIGMRARRASNRFGSFTENLKRFTPNMRQVYKVIAVMLPLVIALGAAALGAATAMLTVAAAGASIAALGLAGEGEDMASAFENAKDKVKELGAELFNVIQPTAQLFAPITDELFDRLPQMMSGNAFESLLVYEDDLYDMFDGLIGWFGDLAFWASENQAAISQLAFRFGDILGSNIIGFFDWLIRETSENQEMFIELGQTLKYLALIIYDVSKFVSRLVTVFKPLISLIRGLTKRLDGGLSGAILNIAVLFGLLYITASKIVLIFSNIYFASLLLSTGALEAIKIYAIAGGQHLQFLAAKAWAAFAALSAVQKALMLTGVGIALAGVGMAAMHTMETSQSKGPQPGGNDGRRGGTVYNQNTYNVNHQGEMDRGQEHRIRDTIEKVNSEERMRSPPEPNTSRSRSNKGQ